MPMFEPFQTRRASADMPAPLAGLQIRLAVPDDVRQLCAIEAERHGSDPAALFPLIERSVASVNPERLTLVAEHDHTVVGFGRAGYFRPAEDAPTNVAPRGWYLAGLVVAAQHRRKGVGRQLTRARLDWIAERDDEAFYFANARNVVSIELHEAFGFTEVTRDFTFPGASFEGGVGVLFRAALTR
jgi:ribosomal protein S18 acetylase RimI-like enzyme